MNTKTIPLAALALLLTSSDAALAYVGPGAGLSLLGALWGLLLAVASAIGFVIVWPLRRARRRARERRAAEIAAPQAGSRPAESTPRRAP